MRRFARWRYGLVLSLVGAPAMAGAVAAPPASASASASLPQAQVTPGAVGKPQRGNPSPGPGTGSQPGRPGRPPSPPAKPSVAPQPAAVPQPGPAPVVPQPAPVVPLPSLPPPPTVDVPAVPAVPLFRIVGYEQKYEYMQGGDEWRQFLGPARYRQFLAGRALQIAGGAAAFMGAASLLVGLGNLVNQTDFGARTADPGQPDFHGFVAGFATMAAVGGAALITGLVLTVPLPPRVRPTYVPQLQREPLGPPSPIVPSVDPGKPAKGAPLSAFPQWAARQGG